MSKVVVQVSLKEKTPLGYRHQTCWVDKMVKRGDQVRLKGDDTLWEVDNVYWQSEHQIHEINRGWDVGGLNSKEK